MQEQRPAPGVESALETPWRRLHPLSPLVRVGGLALVFGLLSLQLLGARSARARDGVLTFMALYLGFALALLALGWIRWLVTRWRITGGDLQIETGLLRRQSFRIPVARIQAVDIVAPWTARMFGLAEVRVVSAGRGTERGRLTYLDAATAVAMRARLLALAHGLAGETPEPPAHPLMRVENLRLGVALLFRGPTLISLVFPVVASIFIAFEVRNPRLGAALIGVLLSTIPPVLGIWLALVSSDFNFTVSAAPDGLRLDRGLLRVRHETIPFSRIQAVRWVEPILWRPFGWCRLEVDVARQAVGRHGDKGADQVARLLMPVARGEEITWLLHTLFPGVAITPPAGAEPPPRARWKAPLSYHTLAVWSGDTHICARTGRVTRSTVILPLTKVQSVRLASGPVQRAFHLATVHIDTAGRRWQASARCRDAADAEQLLAYVATQSRRVRHPAPPRFDTASVTN